MQILVHCFFFPAKASDDECSSIASSNTEIYEEANCQDMEISEEKTQDVVFETGFNDLPASDGVQLQVPSQTKLNKNTAICSQSVFKNAFGRSLKKEPWYLTEIMNYVVEAEYFSQPTEIVSQHKRTCDNVKTSTFDAERGDVEPSTGSSSEKITDALHKTRHEAGLKFCLSCNLLFVIFSISVIPLSPYYVRYLLVS